MNLRKPQRKEQSMPPRHFKPATLSACLIASSVLHFTAPAGNALIVIRDRNGNVVPGATATTLAELTNALASIQIDDKMFENWRGFSSVTTGGALPIDPALVVVAATGEGTCDPGPGVNLLSSQFFVGGIAQSQQTMFSYNVRTLSGSPIIDQLELALAAFQADLAGEIDVTETVSDQNQNPLGTVAVHVDSFGVTPPGAVGQLPLAPPQSFVSITKDIFLANGGPEDQGSALLGSDSQNFSQVCGASVEVTKQIACLPCTTGISCQDLPPDAYSGSATGFKSDTASPIF